MSTVDAMRMLVLAAIALVATVSAIRLTGRPAGVRSALYALALAGACLCAPAAVMAVGSAGDTVVGHASADIPALEDYRAVPPPGTTRRAAMMTLAPQRG